MKKLISIFLIVLLVLAGLSGCAMGKTVLLLVDDTRTDQTQLLWKGFEKQAKKEGMKPILVGLTDETEINYTAYQLWEKAVNEYDPAVVAVVGLTSPKEDHSFLAEREVKVVAVNPASNITIPDIFCVNGATEVDLARMAAAHIIEMAPPSSGRIRLLYNRSNETVEQIFTAMMEEASYLNLECTPLSGRINEQMMLNSFTEDTVATFNASDYDTQAQDISNYMLSVATRTHLQLLQDGQASAIFCRDYETIGQQAAEACAKALRGKTATVINVEPILITANGPDRSGAQYWLDLYE